MAAQDAKQDRNQFPGLLLVQGTAGTSDIDPGTSILVRASGDPSSGAIYTRLLGGTVSTSAVAGNTILLFGTTTAGTIGTLVAAPGVGTAIYVSDVTVVVHNGTAEPVVSYALAANGTAVVVRGLFTANQGVQKSLPLAASSGITNAALTFNNLTGAGTVSYSISYFVQ